ncbi:MAG: hypothetical protein WD511_00705 [Balneolaceae bacterium]
MINNELVRTSRAGDAFHYRWAARRCLKMVYPSSNVESIVIEGSKERDKAGEYNIDVAEYYVFDNSDLGKRIVYYQLKHTTKKLNVPFNLSDLKSTISGFAERFRDLSKDHKKNTFEFKLITNRPVSKKLKKGFQRIIDGEETGKRLKETIYKYTGLEGTDLQEFCELIEFNDGEGAYNEQKYSLHAEISALMAGVIDNSIIENLISLVASNALPHSDGLILKEDVLMRFGVSSERELFPAVSEIEDVSEYFIREQHDEILYNIHRSDKPVIINASGGVGKSVLARQLVNSLPEGSFGVLYDCFDSGRYRALSSSRHRHKTAFTQIINEMATEGLCEPLIPFDTYQDDTIMRRFLSSLRTAAQSLQKANPKALCYVFIDAADNAEMAANDFNDPCFANQLLREALPEGCRIVLLCRPERMNLLKPPSEVEKIELKSFTKNETKEHLFKNFPKASDNDVLEFHRLSSKNPRVQANALSANKATIQELLESLGPSPTTVNEQISDQLNNSINKIKDQLPPNYQQPIESICIGLANLPPLVPISVLAKAASVDENLIKSFVIDIGRPLWLGENSVQFRDEPTESWFRDNFSASLQQLEDYIEKLKPFAKESPYVSEALPSLLHSLGNYEELINLALSDDFLPDDNPIDARNIRIFRLKFAFKSALKEKKYKDATKIAFRAGEEVAGEGRQLDLLAQNVDLIAPLQSEHKVQELAFRRKLKGTWEGSENVFSASLLSTSNDFKGEARSFLRAANNWLQIYFKERDENPEENNSGEDLQDEHIVEMAMANFNIFGVEQLVDFLQSWEPKEVVFRITKAVVKRLIDANKFEIIDEIAQLGDENPFLIIALTQSLLEVGHFPPKETLTFSLNSLASKTNSISTPDEVNYYNKNSCTLTSIISFLEVCTLRGLDHRCIYLSLKYFFPVRASVVVSSRHQKEVRELFLRQAALRFALIGNSKPDIDQVVPGRWIENEESNNQQDISSFKEIVSALLPWYILKAKMLIGLESKLSNYVKEIKKSSNKVTSTRYRIDDHLPEEIAKAKFSLIKLLYDDSERNVNKFIRELEYDDDQLSLKDKIDALRSVFRLKHLSSIREGLLTSCKKEVESLNFESSELKTDFYIEIARAVISQSPEEAAAYFELAIESVSKFGHEMLDRWEAVVDVAERSTSSELVTEKLTYRFVRCLELVGDHVAREKHLNRNGAIRVALNLHPPSAMAALSRWRDRDVGWFEKQIVALATESVKSEILSSRVAFPLLAFDFNYGDLDFLKLCLEKEEDSSFRELMLSKAVEKFRLEDRPETFWSEVKELAEKYSIQNSNLQKIISFYENNKILSDENHNRNKSAIKSDFSEKEWAKLFADTNLLSSDGISAAIKAFDELKENHEHNIFWNKIYKIVSINDAKKFLEALIGANQADKYDVIRALSQMPENWLKRVSIQKSLPHINFLFGKRFSSELVDRYAFDIYLREISNDITDEGKIREGIIEGVSNTAALDGSNVFFGFINTIVPILNPDESVEIFEYALTRFEIHIDEDYADGDWDEWLMPPQGNIESISGLIWAALGSPRAKIRWKAAHCVRLLATMGCQNVIDSIISWMQSGSDGAFGSKKFPFYELHAKLYLLIALARVSIDDQGILHAHHSVFAFFAIDSLPQLLIQKFSAQIALAIEKEFPGTYQSEILHKLENVAISPYPIRTDLSYQDKVDGFWHENVEFEQDIKLHFEYDFDRYWFEPLAQVFGVPSEQVLDFARKIVFDEWSVKTDDGFIIDPRDQLWRSNRNGRETRNYKSGYPDTDSYRFYISYHALFITAQRLLEKMPVVTKNDWDEDPLTDWLKEHILTREDGRWLSDRRDQAPLKRRDWITSNDRNVSSELNKNDFLEGLFIEKGENVWVNVYGNWKDNDGYRSEVYSVNSALISKKVSDSLLNALNTCNDPYDFKLPEYNDPQFEIDDPPFKLNGWVEDNYIQKGIDVKDPYSADISYPPYSLSDAIIKKLNLSKDSESRFWYQGDKLTPILHCEIWSKLDERDIDRPIGEGKRLSGSRDFLQGLCTKLDCELIIEVQIRRTAYKSYGTKEEEFEEGPKSKVYIFSKDGRLRDERTSYKIR